MLDQEVRDRARAESQEIWWCSMRNVEILLFIMVKAGVKPVRSFESEDVNLTEASGGGARQRRHLI